MAIPAGYSLLRSGYVQAGDRIFVPALGSYITVEFDSIYIGSAVDSHSSVCRRGAQPHTTSFTSVRDRCDHSRPGDGCRLVPTRVTGVNNIYRVIAHKDDQFVYLRSILLPSSTTEKVCRKSGKVWTWTPTGWDRMEYEMRLDDEVNFVNVTAPAGKALSDSVYYGD